LQNVAIKTPDGVTLNAWIVEPQHANDEAVVLLHGLADNRLGMIGYAQLLLARGFTVLLPDARAHGSSGGALATFGLLERNDIAQWVQFLRTRTTGHCVYGLGESMGAAQLLQSLGSGADFCAVIAESSFSSFREIAYDRIGQPLHLGPWVGRTILRPVVEAAFLRALWKYGLDMQQVSPEDAVAKTHVPVFLIHGQVDSNIPVRHSRRIVARDRAAVLWEVPGAEHCGALSAAPERFRKVLVTWFPTTSRSMKRVAGE
jgi:pimeloyl-ACP methyl ester carboxylesterase